MRRRAVTNGLAATVVIAASLVLFLGFFFVWVLAPFVAILAYWLVDILVLRRRKPHGPAKRAALAYEADARAKEIERTRGVSAERLL